MAESVTDIRITVQSQDFDLAAEYAALDGQPGIGAVVCFVGRVRDRGDVAGVTALTLEHYPGMTESCLQQIAEQAAQRWPLSHVRVVHRVGTLQLAEQIVLVQVASAHRQAAFEGCAFVMDYLKQDAPFWKKEVAAGGSQWVEAKASDGVAAARWSAVD